MEQFSARRLTWWPELGVGYYPVECGIEPYDQDYFDNFARNAETGIGAILMASRCAFVARHYHGLLVDVGIGSGAFIELRRKAQEDVLGYDVNPVGIAWLKQRGLFVDPYAMRPEAVSLWDVLEHMPDFSRLLACVGQWVFLSLPIFRDAEHVLRSKHYKPREHCWYFTEKGLITVMGLCGFQVVEGDDIETRIGREDILSFAFRRTS